MGRYGQNKTGAKLRVAIKGELARLIDRITARKVVGIWLLNNEKGERLTRSMLRNDFNNARIKAEEKYPHLAKEIGKFQFHDLHAKAATDKEDEKGLEAAKNQLGHASATMTADYVRHRKGKLVDPTK